MKIIYKFNKQKHSQMKRFFINLISGCMVLAATMTVQAQVQCEDINARYYHEIQIVLHDGKYGLHFRSEVVVPYEYDTIIAQRAANTLCVSAESVVDKVSRLEKKRTVRQCIGQRPKTTD